MQLCVSPAAGQVDDLEEIGSLEKYIQRSQSVLIFLSKGYFFSGSPPFTLATLHSLALAPQFQLT